MRVEKGHLLMHRRVLPAQDNRVTFTLYTVTGVRTLKSGAAKVRAICHHGTLVEEIEATFPDGEIREPFHLIQFSDSDRSLMWKRSATAPLPSGDQTVIPSPARRP